MKDLTGSKAKHALESEAEDSAETLAKLERIFSTVNFQSDFENADEGGDTGEDELDLNIGKD